MARKRIDPKEFLDKTADMDLECRGLAVTLLCHYLVRGELPQKTEAIARLAGAFPEEVERHWESIAKVLFPDCSDKPKKQGLDPGEIAAVEPIAIAQKDGGALSPAERHVAIDEVLLRYVELHPKAKPGEPDRRRIASRLKEGFTLADLLTAIEGCHASPFHCGENERQRKYQSLELILRNGDKVNQFIEIAERESAATGKPSTRELQTTSAFQGLLQMEFGDGV